MEDPKSRIIVALDVPDTSAALCAVKELAPYVGMVKIGLELFVSEGPSAVTSIREAAPDLDIFLDLKLHDIPNTMRGAIKSARKLGARFLTVHAGSGLEHLKACVQEAGDELGILAVTVLTSQDKLACEQAGHTKTPAELVVQRAKIAAEAGCAGIVCSGAELAKVVEVAPDLYRVTPGIRPANAQHDDQKRVMTPRDALGAGSTHLVIGRPIMAAPDRVAAAKSILQEIS